METAKAREKNPLGNVPDELKALPWLCYKLVDRPNGKKGKPPCDPTTGHNIDHTDRKHFLTFDQAHRALKANKPGNLAGIGVEMTGAGVVGFDLDDSLTPEGTPLPWAQEILNRIDTYTEVSPSGKGLRLFAPGTIPEAGARRGACEAYQSGHFLTVTGNVFRGRATVKAIPPDTLTWFWKTHIRPDPEPAKPAKPPRPDDQGAAGGPPPRGLPTTPAEVIALAERSKNGDKFRRLFAGDLSDHGDDHSAADLGFACILAFYCGRDPALMDATFRESGLMRPKWDEKHGKDTYGQTTIRKAIERTTETYAPKPERPGQGKGTGRGEEPEEWTTPICFLEKITPPKFPADMLPEPIRSYVEAVADCRQVPVDLPALLSLSVVAAAGARRYRVYVGESHSEPLNIWTVPALQSGSRKTDVFDDMVKPLHIEQRRLTATAREAIEAAKTKQKLHEKRLEHLFNAAAKEKDDRKREEMEEQLALLGAAGIKVPPYPVLFVGGDTTPEAMGALLEDQGGRIAVMDTEGGLFSVMNGRYDEKGEANLDVWLKMHAGDELMIHRRKSPPIEVTKPAGTMALAVQPSVIKDMTGKKDFKERGLLGRFLYAIPESLVGTRLYQNKRVPHQLKTAYLEAVARIFSQPEPVPADEYDRAPHHRLHIKGEALAVWQEFYDDVEKRQAKGGDLEPITDWASKSAGAIARIAGILHLVETGGNPGYSTISLENVVRAYEIGRRHLIEHAKLAYGLMGATADTHLARDILAWLATKGKPIFTASDYWEANRSKADKLDDLFPAFEILEDRGVIRELPVMKTGGRQAKHRYEVNPACKACFRCMKEAEA